MSVPAAASLTVPPHVLTAEVGTEVVFLNLENENYYGLDEIGSRIWMMLRSGGSVASVVDCLCADYDVERQQAQHDIEALLRQLAARGLAEIGRRE